MAAREHSRLELERKLAARGYPHARVAAVLDRLEQGGQLDHARLAARYVEERAGKGYGPRRIRCELLEKGLSDEIIAHHLEPMRDTWPDRLAAVCERRFGARPPTDRAGYAKRARFLEQRGFSTDSIRRFLRWSD